MSFLNSLGLLGVTALLGCWLIVGSIIGKLLAISHVLQRDVLLTRAYQRVLLGVFGAVLLGPGLHKLYYGESSQFVSPQPEEYVAPGSGVSHTSLLPGLPDMQYRRAKLVLVSAGASSTLFQRLNACGKVESFGLYANSIRRLKYEAFHGKVYLYVGDISAPGHGSTGVHLFSTDGSAPADGKIDAATFQRLWSAASPLQRQASIQKAGDSFTFMYGGVQYKITVSQIYKVLLGNDEIVVDICEMTN
jgi:hypothetical protein